MQYSDKKSTSPLRRLQRNSKDEIIRKGLFAVSLIAIFLLAGIFFFLLKTGVFAFSEIGWKEFFFSTNWNPVGYSGAAWGVLGLLVGTVLVTGMALLIAAPLGIGAAIYLSELAPPKIRYTLKTAIEFIASIPSVVLGLIGLLFLSPLFAKLFGLTNGLNAFTASVVVTIMLLPTIISISEDVLRSLPQQFREASIGAGATKWQMIRTVLLKAARPGLIAALLLAMGRAIGETMAVLMVAGNARAMPLSIFDPARPMTATIAIEIKEVVQGSVHYQALFAIGLYLFLLTFLFNVVAEHIIKKQKERYSW